MSKKPTPVSACRNRVTSHVLAFATIAAVCSLGYGSPAISNEYDPSLGWQTRKGALICGRYSNIKDAEAAVRADDNKWLKELDCTVATGGLKLTMISDPPYHSDADIKRARITLGESGITIYLRGWDAVNFAPAGTFKTKEEAEKAFAEMVKSYKKAGYSDMPDHIIIPLPSASRVTLLIGPTSYYSLTYFCHGDRHCNFPGLIDR